MFTLVSHPKGGGGIFCPDSHLERKCSGKLGPGRVVMLVTNTYYTGTSHGDNIRHNYATALSQCCSPDGGTKRLINLGASTT